MINNAYEAGKRLLCGAYTQYTPSGKGLFLKSGRYGKEPKIGSIIYFYSNTMGRVAHVGVVVSVSTLNGRFHIKTIEGNTSSKEAFVRNGGCVAIKEYVFPVSDVGGKNRINGFGYPRFDDSTCSVDDFLRVLFNEVGYLEKASNASLDDKTANAGDKNYTKYGKWYGGNGLYWCQQFVSWCAYTACSWAKNAQATEWLNVDGKWNYKLHGVMVKGQWLKIDDRWYVFDEAGNMITGWFQQDDDWYYLNPEDGAMLSGQWVKKEYKDYYLTKTGIMAKGCYVAGKDIYYWVDENGEYQKQFDTKTPDLNRYELAI